MRVRTTKRTLSRALLAGALAALAGCGGGGRGSDGGDDDGGHHIPSPAPVVRVDALVRPSVTKIIGFDGASERTVSALTDASGVPLHFVDEELIVVSDDDAAVQAIAQRWGGRVERSFVPGDFALPGPAMHLLRVDPAGVDPSALAADLQALDPVVTGELRVSNEAGLRLFALAVRESAAGTPTGLNLVMTPTGFRERSTREGSARPLCVGGGPPGCLASGVGGAGFTSDAFTWSYMGLGAGTQNIGVGEAWRALDLGGLLGNKVRVAVIDAGFAPSDDMPAAWEHHPNSISETGFTEGDLLCSGRPCPWHGTNVVSAAMGVADDGKGAAGPAGPVAEAITIRLSGDVFNYLGAWAIAFTSGARVLNMSFGARVPALASVAVTPLDLATRAAHDAGLLLVASAGNDGGNVDEEDCVPGIGFPCWEKAWIVPCENGGVLCVGALADNASGRRPDSNFGDKDVDLFGPGAVWVGGDRVDPAPHAFGGTSAAAPFVAGVGALVMAANPALSGREVAQILTDTAHPSSDPGVRRYVNAYGAVVQALGGSPVCLLPEIATSPLSRDTAPCLAHTFSVAARTDGPHFGPFQYQWRKYQGNVAVALVDDGRITGTRSDVMSIDPLGLDDVGTYDVVVTNPCGSTASARAFVRMVDGASEQGGSLPEVRKLHAMAYDSNRGRMVLHGGAREILSPQGFVVSLSVELTTLERDAAGAWQVVDVRGPPARYNHALAYDEARGVTVLFGGFLCADSLCNPGNPGAPLVYGDTWEWDGIAWSERAAPGPSARWLHAMTYDPVRRRVVMHGGRDASAIQLGDLWEWDGVNWVERNVAGDPTPGQSGSALGWPPGRENHALAFDRTRNVLVLHGGGYFLRPPDHTGGDTWELDGEQWRRVALPGPATGGLLFAEGMAFDHDRGRLLLFTQNNGGGTLPGLLWEWGGTQWAPKSTLPFRAHTAMAYDSGRRRTTLAGGETIDGLSVADTREWRYFDSDPMCVAP